MKKYVLVVIALLCVCSVAFATGVNSPSLGDLPNSSGSFIKTENGNDAANAGMLVEALNEFSPRFELPEYQELIKVGENELAKLQAAEKVTSYFGDVIVASTGKVVPLLDLFDGIEPEIYEFSPVIAGGYDLSYGHVTATLLFATPYEPGQEVAVLIGVIEYPEDDEGEQTVTWYAFRGLCVSVPEVDGAEGIEVEFPPEMMTILQDKDTLIAIASQAFDFE